MVQKLNMSIVQCCATLYNSRPNQSRYVLLLHNFRASIIIIIIIIIIINNVLI